MAGNKKLEKKSLKVRSIRCPQCNKLCEYSEANVFRPFCSERCRTHDTAAWASENYKVAGEPIDPEAASELTSRDLTETDE